MRALIRELIETAILALLIFIALQASVQNFRVEGSSMEPTLKGGQYLLVNKLVYFSLGPSDLRRLLPFDSVDPSETLFAFHPPRRGEIIIFHFPRDETRDFVKRVIGVAGDEVEIRRGTVFVNGLSLDEPYITHPSSSSMARLIVPPESFFVLGDRFWGT